DQLHQALRRTERLGDPNLRRNVAASMGLINRELGRLADRVDRYRRDVAVGPHAWREAALIRVLAQAGQFDEATERLGALLARQDELLAGFLRRYCLVVMAETAEIIGHIEAAEHL